MTYQLNWLKCARDYHQIEVDYIGLWNEMPWGSVQYVKELKKAIPELDDPADRKCIDERNLRIRAIDGVIAEYEDEITSRRVIVSAAENEVSRRRELPPMKRRECSEYESRSATVW